jgi:hypothetical protein
MSFWACPVHLVWSYGRLGTGSALLPSVQSIALCFPCFDFHCFPYACSLLISVLVGRWWVHELLGSLSAGGTGGFSVIIASGGPSTCYLFSLEDNFFLLISNCLSQFKVLPQYLCGLVLTFERACKHYHYFRVECCIGIFTTPYTTREGRWLNLLFTPLMGGTWCCSLYYEDWVYSFNIYHSSLFLTKIALSFRAVLYYLHFMSILSYEM